MENTEIKKNHVTMEKLNVKNIFDERVTCSDGLSKKLF